MNDDYNTLGDKVALNIKIERIRKSLTQEQLAFEADLDRGTISKIETKKISPTIKTLEKIAKALDIETEVLLGCKE